MWITQLFGQMCIWLHYLYMDLRSVPATQFSVDPGFWHLRDTSAAPTTGKSFLQSLNFFADLLAFRSFSLADAVSARVRGVIHTMQISKAPLKQARPLSVKEVQALEELTVDPSVPTLSAMAGFFMFCVMNCCCFSDAQWAL